MLPGTGAGGRLAALLMAIALGSAPGRSSAGEPTTAFDPRLRGVALGDLADFDDAQMAALALRLPGALPLDEVLSTSVFTRDAHALVVDVVGRAKRFVDSDERRHPRGRVGVLRVSVPVGLSDQRCDLGPPTVLWERSLAELDLRARLSIIDWALMVEDRELGFRRVYPIGGGGIDRGVRFPGLVSSMTPTTEDGLLEKRFAWRKLHSPWYFRDKPYLPVSLGRTLTRRDGTTYKVYGESKVAFHIWQDKGFERGYFSHGCIRMRTEDLDELAAFVFGARTPIPIVLRLDPIADAFHPYPLDTRKYWQLKNFGTKAKPRTRLKYMLHEMELGTEPLPSPDELVPFTFDSKPIVQSGRLR